MQKKWTPAISSHTLYSLRPITRLARMTRQSAEPILRRRSMLRISRSFRLLTDKLQIRLKDAHAFQTCHSMDSDRYQSRLKRDAANNCCFQECLEKVNLSRRPGDLPKKIRSAVRVTYIVHSTFRP